MKKNTVYLIAVLVLAVGAMFVNYLITQPTVEQINGHSYIVMRAYYGSPSVIHAEHCQCKGGR